jgi:hypothetical protein
VDQSNSAKGRSSFDATIGNSLVNFVNRNISPYPTEVGSVNFDLVPIENHKDLMINAARRYAQQEYDRIMQLVEVLQQQATDIKRRLDLTDQVHAAKYNFQPYQGQIYWLVQDTKHNCSRLVQIGPTEWSTGAPAEYVYIQRIQWLGDYTWQEV